MKHLKEARQLLNQGDAQGALDIIENILAFSPKNPDALLLKAHILDEWGRFDDSLSILHFITKISNDEEIVSELDRRIEEDRESLVHSKLTPDGRWYFPFSPKQIFISLFGLMGCVLFLISSPSYYNELHGGVLVGISFFILVLLPWTALLILNFQGIKKILVGLNGIQVYYGMKKMVYNWEQLGSAVIEYDRNLNAEYLRLILYSRTTREPLLNIDISKKSGAIKARRHFVRLILSYIDVVSYVSRGKATEQPEENENRNHVNAA
ncbi:MAG: tetratricopeptide repeat protein [Bdellovibrionota bacterium]